MSLHCNGFSSYLFKKPNSYLDPACLSLSKFYPLWRCSPWELLAVSYVKAWAPLRCPSLCMKGLAPSHCLDRNLDGCIEPAMAHLVPIVSFGKNLSYQWRKELFIHVASAIMFILYQNSFLPPLIFTPSHFLIQGESCQMDIRLRKCFSLVVCSEQFCKQSWSIQ